jgi:hypothetical protein
MKRRKKLSLLEMALAAYASEVRDGTYPSPAHCYPIEAGDMESLRRSKHWVGAEKTVSG